MTIICPEINNLYIVMLLQVNKVQKVADSPQVPRSLKWSKRDKMEFLRQLMRWGLPLVSSIIALILNIVEGLTNLPALDSLSKFKVARLIVRYEGGIDSDQRRIHDVLKIS